jgi:biotin carboxylase
MDDRPLILLVAPGPRPYREYLFASLARRYRVHLLHVEETTWERRYLSGWQVVPDFAAGTLVAAARALDAGTPVAGVLSWDEARIQAASQVAAALGLPGDPEAVARCRDKYRSRERLERAGVPQPGFARVGTLEEALSAAQKIGYPVVLKPRAAAASYGVVRVDDEEELRRHFSFAATATVADAIRHDEPVLVEEYVSGAEVSVDAVVSGGVVTPVFLARKQIGFGPFFEETGHLVEFPSPLLEGTLPELLTRVHDAIGFRDGWTHTEVKLGPQGPRVIEVNARLGGDLIPYLGQLASGLEPGLLAAAAACGTAPRVAPTRTGVAGIRFCYPEQECEVTRAAFDPVALPPEVDRAEVLAVPGRRVAPPPAGLLSGRMAFVTAVAGTAQGCTAALDRGVEAFRWEAGP